MSRVFLVEPFCGGSHAAWAQGFAQYSQHQVVVVSHPGSFWRWRFRGGSVTLAEATQEAVEQFGQPDLVLVSSMVDLSAWLGLTRRFLGDPPVVLYMHENQLGYPLSPQQKANDEFPLANWRSLVAADQVWFNSDFHRQSLLSALPALLDRAPDQPQHHLLSEVGAKSLVMPVGVELGDVPAAGQPNNPPLVLWNQRWDYDKNPHEVMDALVALAEEGLSFSVALVGENVRENPREIEEAKEKLADRVVAYGFLPREEYVRLVGQTDVVISAAHHEFFGIAVVEALAAGAVPVLPAHQSYPELIPEAWHEAALYPPGQLVERLRLVVNDFSSWHQKSEGLAFEMRRFSWASVAADYDSQIDELLTRYGQGL